MTNPGRAIPLVGIALAVVAAVTAGALAAYSWKQVAGYKSPYVTPPLPEAAAGSAETSRVVVVILDGLRYDVSRQMHALGTLREHGADFELTVGQPSLSFPGWTAILSGAPQRVSGVVTNGFSRRVPVETLLDVAIAAGRRTVVVGPYALDRLYGARRADAHYFRDYTGTYLSSDLVAHTVDLAVRVHPEFVLLHLPDADEAGHASGGASKAYRDTAARLDTDISVLVNYLQDGHTTFVFVADHGHTDAGGHGGWEPDVLGVPCVIAGPGVALSSGTGRLVDVAPTVAAIAGLPTPRDSLGTVLRGALASPSAGALAAARAERARMVSRVLEVVTGPAGAGSRAIGVPITAAAQDAAISRADAGRLAAERAHRLPFAALLVLLALLVLVAIGGQSWRALAASLAGVAAYYLVYDGLYFGVHRLAWSLSSINSEDRMLGFFATRVVEAAAAGAFAVAVAALAYPLLRSTPKGPDGGYRVGWLSLGPAVVLAVQATLAAQVAWYIWQWGVTATWILPDLRLGFKYDLDLLQMTALGIVALASPLVTVLVGRYHPRVPRTVANADGNDPS